MSEELGDELTDLVDETTERADESTVDVPKDAFVRRLEGEDGPGACLVFLSGPLMGHTVGLEDRPREVGRADDADIVIADSGVSRRHARFHVTEGKAVVEDLDSSNGVFVNGERIERIAKLTPGDKISLGTETILKFTYHDRLDEDFQQRLLDSAIRDPLTGLYNRGYFDRQLAAEFGYAVRHETLLGLILLDIDHFKEINDTHGHLVGDEVLEHLGKQLGGAVREEDFLARYGGEELAMLCRGLDGQKTRRAAERLRNLVEEMVFQVDDLSLTVTVSGGVAAYPDSGAESPHGLIEAADRALYRAKEAGRNRVIRAVSSEDK
ncbi:MAG: diguanylate cyclase [Persicimonas sp.]